MLVSTDKAVKPSSVMGASKRVAEMLVADTARRTGRPMSPSASGTCSARMAPWCRSSRTSSSGRPLTITHPDMTRYFMTIPEASWLILDAAALGSRRPVRARHGQALRIVDLARDVVRLAGRDPDTQPIEFVGLRPGEKLHEELFYDAEQVEPTQSRRSSERSPRHRRRTFANTRSDRLAPRPEHEEDELRTALLKYATKAERP